MAFCKSQAINTIGSKKVRPPTRVVRRNRNIVRFIADPFAQTLFIVPDPVGQESIVVATRP
jgi:hypothetical protein